MKKFSLFFLFASIFALNIIVAQDMNSKVTTGVIAYDGQRYDEAIDKLTEAVTKYQADNVVLKPKNAVKAYYYLMSSYVRVLSDPALKAKFEPKYADLEGRAFDAYMNAKGNLDKAGGDKGAFSNGITLAQQMLFPAIFNKGANLYMEGSKDNNVAKYKEALGLLAKSKELEPENYLPYFMLGYAQFMTKDSAGAIVSWENAIVNYDKAKAAGTVKADDNMSNVYITLAENYMSFKKDTKKALETIEKGIKEFPADGDLKRTELGIYQRDANYLQAALGKFKANLDANPKDIDVRLAYANMLEKSGNNGEALSQYKEAIKSEPDNFVANANLGAFYVNTAAALSEDMKKTEDENEIDRLNNAIKENFRLAYPHIKKAQAARPEDPTWIDQMFQITSFLISEPGMEDEMKVYLAKKDALRNKK